MLRLTVFVTTVALSVAVAAMNEGAFAKEHPQLHQPHFANKQFRRANAAIVAVPEVPSTMYTGGWSAPAGH
jgi:hypothetical protein